MRLTRGFVVMAVWLATIGAIGSAPRYIEELRIGGGYGESVDGGVDIEDDGTIKTNGAITTAGNVAVNGGTVSSTNTSMTLDPSGDGKVTISGTDLSLFGAGGRLWMNSTTASAVNNTCHFRFNLLNSAGNYVPFGGIWGISTGVTAGAEEGIVRISVTSAGSTVYDALQVDNGGDLKVKKDLYVQGGDILSSGALTINGTGTLTLADPVSCSSTLTAGNGFMPRHVNDGGMDATNTVFATPGEIVYNDSDNKAYVCTAVATPATWAALN